METETSRSGDCISQSPPVKICLVTGGAGFIGSHIVDKLLESGNDVICLDNFMTGKHENLDQARSSPNFKLVQCDVEILADLRVDFIYHLACPASPYWYQADPIRTLRTSILGTLRVCELARECGARVLLASTSEVYGDPAIHPQVESYNGNVSPIGPRACYDEGKRAAETVCSEYARHYGVDIRIARIFNTYGPRMSFDDGRVVSNFIVQGLKGESLSLYGDGSQTRSLCYVDDLVRGLVSLMNIPPTPNIWQPINLGNPSEITVKGLGVEICSLLGIPATFEHRTLPQDDPCRRSPDISRAKDVLDWKPSVGLEQGLTRTISDFRSRFRNDVTVIHQKGAILSTP